MRFSYRRGHRTALAYDVRAWIHQLEREELFMPIHKLGKRHTIDVDVTCPTGPVRATKFVSLSAGLNTELGSLSNTDILQFVTMDGTHTLGSAIGFGRTSSRGSQYEFAAFVHPLDARGLSPCTWRRQSNHVVVVWANDMFGSVPYSELDSGDIAALLQPAS